jgi:predicted metal-dependent enzyme (double-stranded beta helix superfamily)
MANKRLPAFQKFIDDLRAAFADAAGDTEQAMTRAREILEALTSDDSIHAHSKDWPSTEGHKNLLLHEDPDYKFVVNAVVRTAGRQGGIHDHAQTWTAYGVLDGEEKLERYKRLDDGTKEGYCDIELESVSVGRRGVVDLVPPYDIHSEKGGPQRSVAVIVRSERVAESGLQGRYNRPDIHDYTQGTGPTQVPFEINAPALQTS